MTTEGHKLVRLEPDLNCRLARKLIRARGTVQSQGAAGDDSRLRAHLTRCTRCEAEARINQLYRFILGGDSGDATEPPDAIWFRGLRARIEREDWHNSNVVEDSFARTVSVVAQQMVPVMVTLVLLIVGATLFWTGRPDQRVGSTDPVLMNQVVEYPQPTTDDVLGTLLAVEDKKNGK